MIHVNNTVILCFILTSITAVVLLVLTSNETCNEVAEVPARRTDPPRRDATSRTDLINTSSFSAPAAAAIASMKAPCVHKWCQPIK
jgi:hypothetical protein